MKHIKCINCGSACTINITPEQSLELSIWPRRLIQEICPDLSADDREMLISGMCGVCYDKMCEELEEEDNLLDSIYKNN